MKRNENESFEDYKKRRTEQNNIDKKKLRTCRLAWNSYRWKTYIRRKHGTLI